MLAPAFKRYPRRWLLHLAAAVSIKLTRILARRGNCENLRCLPVLPRTPFRFLSTTTTTCWHTSSMSGEKFGPWSSNKTGVATATRAMLGYQGNPGLKIKTCRKVTARGTWE